MTATEEVEQLEQELALKKMEALYESYQTRVQTDKSPEMIARYKQLRDEFAAARQASRVSRGTGIVAATTEEESPVGEVVTAVFAEPTIQKKKGWWKK
jgi:hypothetical protein